jgi:UDP-sulfoquinovose synthase
MKILIAGGDGYCGWASALHLSARDHDVTIIDNLIRREWDREHNLDSLVPIATLDERVKEWHRLTGKTISFVNVDVTNYSALCDVINCKLKFDTLVHFAQQRSAPFSMIDHDHAIRTHINNTVGNMNILWALHEYSPHTHLVKLGTMGEYGTPNIDVEEGFITIEHKGRSDRLPYPKQPGSFYHLTKVSDSDQINFACRSWNLRATDLNQGIVYGYNTDQIDLSPLLANRYDYDHIFGTVLNRFCIQAALGHPLTVYGTGGQTRSFLDIRDTVKCIEIACEIPAKPGEYRVFNQFTQMFSVMELAKLVQKVSIDQLGIPCQIAHLKNPRTEKEVHYYNCINTNLRSYGLEPILLSNKTIASLIQLALKYKHRVNIKLIPPQIQWKPDNQDKEIIRENGN